MGEYYRWDALGISRDQFETELLSTFTKALCEFAKGRSGKKALVDKVTPYLGTSKSVATSIRRYFPDAKIVFLIRDGRDVLTSGVFDWMKRSDEGTARYRHFVESEEKVTMERFFTDDDIRTWCDYWTDADETLENLACPYHVVRFEAMKEDLETELGQLFKFLSVGFSDEILSVCSRQSSFEKMSRGRKPGHMDPVAKVRKGIAGDWRNYFTIEDAEQFLGQAGSLLKKWGYEPDDTWKNELPDQVSFENSEQVAQE